jgi:uncharacterized membrane protein HdeD (DUF308 family)
MYFTLIIIGLIVILCSLYAMENKLKTNIFVMSVVGLLIVWATILLVVVKINSNRRKYAWNQYYWRSIGNDTKTKCK